MKQAGRTILGMRVAALLEIIFFFLFFFVLSIFLGIGFNYFLVTPHPFWIAVIFISAQYGTVEGLLCALVATIIFLMGPMPERSILESRGEYFFHLTKTPFLWFLMALLLGELRMKHIRERDHLRMLAFESTEKEKKLSESYEWLKKIKERLEMRLASEMPTTLMVIDAYKKLQEAKGEEVLDRAAEWIQLMIAPEKFSIFLLESNQLNLAKSSGWESGDSFLNTFSASSPLFNEVIERGRVVSLVTSDFNILEKEGMLAAPIQSSFEKKAIGLIKIEKIPFQRIQFMTVESLRIIGESLGKIYGGR